MLPMDRNKRVQYFYSFLYFKRENSLLKWCGNKRHFCSENAPIKNVSLFNAGFLLKNNLLTLVILRIERGDGEGVNSWDVFGVVCPVTEDVLRLYIGERRATSKSNHIIDGGSFFFFFFFFFSAQVFTRCVSVANLLCICTPPTQSLFFSFLFFHEKKRYLKCPRFSSSHPSARNGRSHIGSSVVANPIKYMI